MKIALPVKDDYQIEKDFENCEYYQIFTINEKMSLFLLIPLILPKVLIFSI